MSKFSNINNKKKLRSKFVNYLRKIKLSISNYFLEIAAFLRYLGFHNNKFYNLKKYKNIHLGSRCFILATGPSLTIDDIRKLDKEVTFSMNSICLNENLKDWRPTYYGIQDFNVYEKIENKLKDRKDYTVFISHRIAKRYKISSEWIQYPLNTDYHSYDLRYNKKYYAKFSSDSYRIIYDGYTITYSLIQLAVYMGFKEIYLLGADNSYDKKKKNHIVEHGVVDPTFLSAGERMNVAYRIARDYTNKKNIKIYNATRGGKLEVFPRVNLDSVLEGANK